VILSSLVKGVDGAGYVAGAPNMGCSRRADGESRANGGQLSESGIWCRAVALSAAEPCVMRWANTENVQNRRQPKTLG